MPAEPSDEFDGNPGFIRRTGPEHIVISPGPVRLMEVGFPSNLSDGLGGHIPIPGQVWAIRASVRPTLGFSCMRIT